jgi:hypothetical protein
MESHNMVCHAVNVSWESDWAYICDDNILRLEYHIAIAEPLTGGNYIDAVCRLMITSRTPAEMSGRYYMLPPFDESTLNCKWGTITFRRIEEKATLAVPDGFTLKAGDGARVAPQLKSSRPPAV